MPRRRLVGLLFRHSGGVDRAVERIGCGQGFEQVSWGVVEVSGGGGTS